MLSLSRVVIWIRSNVVIVHILLGLIIYVLSGLKILRTEKGFGSGTPLCIQTDQTPFLKSNTNFIIHIYSQKHLVSDPISWFP